MVMTERHGEEPAELKVFEKDVGIWDADVTVRPTPDAEPQRSRGVSTRRMLGGAWLVTDYEADSGFAGHGVHGFDRVRGTYVGTWVDSMRTFMAISEGTWDGATHTMTFVTEATLPGGRTLRFRETTENVGADTQVFRSFMPAPGATSGATAGAEFETMTITYQRRSG